MVARKKKTPKPMPIALLLGMCGAKQGNGHHVGDPGDQRPDQDKPCMLAQGFPSPCLTDEKV